LELVSIKNRNFALIGYPLTHSMSPFIHKRLFTLSGIDESYRNIEIPPEQLDTQFHSLTMLRGFNVTIPHKTAIIPFLTELESKAALFESVNTVVCGDTLKGYNTDTEGFLRSLSHCSVPLSGRVLIAGAGGTARMFAFEAALHGCDTTICCRDQSIEKAKKLKTDVQSKLGGASISVLPESDIEGTYDLLLNSTPLGMYPNYIGRLPLKETILSRCAAVFDAVYNPEDTALLQLARANGARAVGGMRMLVLQAVAAHEIWNQTVFSQDDIETLIVDTNVELQRVFSK